MSQFSIVVWKNITGYISKTQIQTIVEGETNKEVVFNFNNLLKESAKQYQEHTPGFFYRAVIVNIIPLGPLTQYELYELQGNDADEEEGEDKAMLFFRP